MGSYSIQVTIANLYLSSTYTFNVVVQNSAPVFASTTSTTISVTVTQTVTFSLPSYSDPDGNAITLTTYQDGSASLPSFVAFTLATNSYSISPTSLSEVAAYIIDAQICDGQPLCSIFTFTITVTSDTRTLTIYEMELNLNSK